MSLDKDTVDRIKHMANFMDKEKIAEVFKIPSDVVQDVIDGQLTGSDQSTTEKSSRTQVIEKVRYVKHRIVTAIGPGGGVGKSTLLTALAVSSAMQTHSPVALIDFSESANLTHHIEMGLFAPERVANPMLNLWPSTVPSRDQIYQQLLVTYPELDNLYVLPGLSTLDSYKSLNLKSYCKVLNDLEGYFEAIFVDLPSLMMNAEDVLKQVDLILIITDCSYVSIAGLPHLYHSLESLGLAGRTMNVINKIGLSGNLSRDEVLELLKEAIPGIYVEAFLAYDVKMVNANKVEYSLSETTAYTKQVRRLLGKINPDWKVDSSSGKGFGSFLRKITGI